MHVLQVSAISLRQSVAALTEEELLSLTECVSTADSHVLKLAQDQAILEFINDEPLAFASAAAILPVYNTLTQERHKLAKSITLKDDAVFFDDYLALKPNDHFLS